MRITDTMIGMLFLWVFILLMQIISIGGMLAEYTINAMIVWIILGFLEVLKAFVWFILIDEVKESQQ